MKSKEDMTPKDLYNHIVQFMTPEQALLKMLESSIIQYDKLKFENQENSIHPLIIIANATLDMGWSILVESKEENVRGLCIGTQEYLDTIFFNYHK